MLFELTLLNLCVKVNKLGGKVCRNARRVCYFPFPGRPFGYASRIEERDGPLFAAMKQLSDQFPRFGDRRILIYMGQLGHAMGPEATMTCDRIRVWKYDSGCRCPDDRQRFKSGSRPQELTSPKISGRSPQPADASGFKAFGLKV